MEPLAVYSDTDAWGCTSLHTENGQETIASADPSNIWKENGYYYMQAGNLCVLNTYGRSDENSPYAGDWTSLYRSADLKNWEYVGRFYTNPHTDPTWPDASEDDMCPAFYPLPDGPQNASLSDTWIQIFIAHNRGAQYYTGIYDMANECFLPEHHGRFSWNDNTCFAPECLMTPDNRLLVWYWLYANFSMPWEQHGWTGMYSFPRQLWLENGILHMAPAEELDRLQIHENIIPAEIICSAKKIQAGDGRSFRIKAVIDLKNGQHFGIRFRMDEETGEYSEIVLDTTRNILQVRTACSENAAKYIDYLFGCKGLSHKATVVRDGYMLEEAPLQPHSPEEKDSLYTLDFFADQSIVEVYVNHTQAVCRELYPTNPQKATGLEIFSDGADLLSMQTYGMMRTNPY